MPDPDPARVAEVVPYYERTLDSFGDHVITKARPSRDSRGWYALLDVGPKSWPSDPDFARYALTKAKARKMCADAIREDARGIGRYAPHNLLKPGYDLHFRLMRYWAEKEQNP